jgi:hypothetical protein
MSLWENQKIGVQKKWFKLARGNIPCVFSKWCTNRGGKSMLPSYYYTLEKSEKVFIVWQMVKGM